MTDNEIRIAMAELDGWKFCGTGAFPIKGPTGVPPTSSGLHHLIKDYPNDLNACRAVVLKIQTLGVSRKTFTDIFIEVARKHGDVQNSATDTGDVWRALIAEPRVICESILRATGKWKD